MNYSLSPEAVQVVPVILLEAIPALPAVAQNALTNVTAPPVNPPQAIVAPAVVQITQDNAFSPQVAAVP